MKKKTLFLTAILGAVFAAPRADAVTGTYVNVRSGDTGDYATLTTGTKYATYGIEFLSGGGFNSKNDYTPDAVIYLKPPTEKDIEVATNYQTIYITADSDENRTVTWASLEATASDANIIVQSNPWNNSTTLDFTINKLTVNSNGTAALRIIKKDNKGVALTVNALAGGSLSTLENSGSLTLGTGFSGTVTGTFSNTGTLTNNGTLTLADGAVIQLQGMAPESSKTTQVAAGTNGFSTVEATYTLVNSGNGLSIAENASVSLKLGNATSTTAFTGGTTATYTGNSSDYYINDADTLAWSNASGATTVTVNATGVTVAAAMSNATSAAVTFNAATTGTDAVTITNGQTLTMTAGGTMGNVDVNGTTSTIALSGGDYTIGNMNWYTTNSTNTTSRSFTVAADANVTMSKLKNSWGLNSLVVDGTLTVTGTDGDEKGIYLWGPNSCTISGTGTITTSYLTTGNWATYNMTVANLNVENDVTIGQALTITGTTIDVDGTVTSNAALNLSGTTLKLSNAIVNKNSVTISGATKIDVAGMTGTAGTESTVTENGYSTHDVTYELVSTNAATVSDGATLTYWKGSTQLEATESGAFNGTELTVVESTGKYYVVESGSSVNYSTIADANSISVASGTTLKIDATGADLSKVTGAGTVSVAAATTLSDKSLATTGALVINGSTLTLQATTKGTGSISTASSVTLSNGGTLEYNHNYSYESGVDDSIKNLAVWGGNTGTLYLNDMAGGYDQDFSGSQTLNLTGTTFVRGTLNIQNKWAGMLDIASLRGEGSISIQGVNKQGTLGSASEENIAYTFTLGAKSDSQDSFCGTITLNNSKASLDLDGNSVYTSDSTLYGATIVGTAGTINLGDTALKKLSLEGATVNVTGTASVDAVTVKSTQSLTVKAGKSLTYGSGSFTVAASDSDITFTIADATEKGLNDAGVTISNADVTISGATELKNTLSGGTLTADNASAAASGSIDVAKITVNAGKTLTASGSSVATTEAVIGNGATLNISNDAEVTISTLTLSGGTLTINNHKGTLTTTTLNVTGNAALNANLAAGTITFGVVGTGDEAKAAKLTMGCDVTINTDTVIKLNGDLVTLIQGYTTPMTFDLIDGTVTDGTSSLTLTGSAADYLENGGLMTVYDTNGNALSGIQLGYNSETNTLYVTPEPATATLSLLALAGLAARRRRH